MTESELKPCPFCGGDAERQMTGRATHFGWCERCDARGPANIDAAQAIAAWNTRTHPPEYARLIEVARHAHAAYEDGSAGCVARFDDAMFELAAALAAIKETHND